MSAPVPDPLEAAALIGRLLDAVERGELDASATHVAALIGARLALEALAQGGNRSLRTSGTAPRPKRKPTISL